MRKCLTALMLCCLLPAAFCPAQEAGSGGDQLDFANGLFSRGFFEEAAEEYEVFLQANPSGPEAPNAWFRLGQCAQASGNAEKASAAFLKAAELTQDPALRVRARLSLGESLVSAKKNAEAVDVLTPLCGEDQSAEVRGRALYYIGRAQASLGNQEQAAKSFEALVGALPDHALTPYAQYQLAFVQMARNLHEDAAITFSHVAENTKADAALRMESRFRTAEIYDKIGWFSAAVGAYEQLKAEFPDSDYARRADYGYTWSLYHARKYPEAAAAAEKFLTANTDPSLVPGMQYLLANCLQQQKEFDRALEIYRALPEKHADSPFAAQAKAKIPWTLHLKGDPAGAKAAALAYLQEDKESPAAGEVGFLLGLLLHAEGNNEDARQEFRLVAEKFPESEFAAEALYKSAECTLQLGMRDDAAKTFEEFVRRYPDNPLAGEAILRAGDAQFNSQDFAKAVEKYTALLAAPATPEAEENARYRLAITYHNMKERGKAAEQYQALLEKFPASRYAAQALFHLGEFQLRDQKDALKAIESYQAALDKSPGPELSALALRGLALARYERKDYEMAADQFLRLIREFPQTVLPEEVYTWCGQWFYDANKWAEAVAVLDALLKALPEYPYADKVRFTTAECAEKAGDTADALARYQGTVEANPTGAKAVEAKFRMAKLHEQAGEEEKALALYEEASSANTGEVAAQARFRLGELFEARGEHERAARNFMRVAILFLHETLSPQALARAGQCYEQAGLTAQALGAYDELLKDYPESEPAPKAREAVDRLRQAGTPAAPAKEPGA